MSNSHDDEKWRAYPNTLLEFPDADGAAIDLRRPLEDRDRETLRTLGLEEPFAVITAENPCGQNAEDAASELQAEIRDARNRERMTRLLADLDRGGYRYRLVDGVSPDGEYREHSAAIITHREDAIELARRHQQLAIFWFDGTDFWLYPVELTRTPLHLPHS